jgi:A/G-specific adenine glycosylase
MLQQTQVERVIPLYEAFLARFPSFEALAAADAGDVVRAWRGLGLEHPPLAETRTLDTLALAAVPRGAGHDWNSAMMDLGSTICTARAARCLVCPLREACAAAPVDAAVLAQRARAHAPRRPAQNAIPFERTTRFLRGRIIDRLRDVPARESLAVEALQRDLSVVVPADRLHEIPAVVDALVRDGIVTRSAASVRLS